MKINSWKDIWKGPFWTDNYGWVENDEDWYSDSGHEEVRPYSDKVYLDKHDAIKAICSIDKKNVFSRFTACHVKHLYLKEIEVV